MLVLEPIFEADLPDEAYGFRPGRNAHHALDAIRQHLLMGYTDVVDADIAAYFDSIPHRNLLRFVAKRIVDRGILNLIHQWLRAPVIEPDAPPGSKGRRSDKGTRQGGVISPLLAVPAQSRAPPKTPFPQAAIKVRSLQFGDRITPDGAVSLGDREGFGLPVSSSRKWIPCCRRRRSFATG